MQRAGEMEGQNGLPPPDTAANLRRMAKNIELWVIEKLIPWARNPRTHSDAQVAQIAASIAEFGFNNPILVDSKAGIIAGHGRLLAARKLGLTEVPVIVLDHLSEAQKRAYIIADNQLALQAGWDDVLLREELAALQAEDFDLDMLGFDPHDLDTLLGADDEEKANAAPPLPERPMSRLGDLWLLGPHRVRCGDATSADVVARLLADRKPRLMVTDPPYGIELDSEWRDRAGLNGHGPAEPSYMKNRTAGHTETTISGDTRADWSEVFELMPSLEVAYVWHASRFTREVLDGSSGSASFITSRSSGTRAEPFSRARSIGSSTNRAGSCERRTLRGTAKPARTRPFGNRHHPNSSWAAPTRTNSTTRRRSPSNSCDDQF
jgi:hypothetical protein